VKRGSLTEVTNALLRLVKTAKYSGNTNYSDKKFLILHKPDETRAPLTETAVNKNGRSPGSSLRIVTIRAESLVRFSLQSIPNSPEADARNTHVPLAFRMYELSCCFVGATPAVCQKRTHNPAVKGWSSHKIPRCRYRRRGGMHMKAKIMLGTLVVLMGTAFALTNSFDGPDPICVPGRPCQVGK
jgi:hypothetical protein